MSKIQKIRDIVYSSSFSGDEEVYKIGFDGNQVEKLISTTQGITNRTPEWSPDSKSIVFQSNRDGVMNLHIFSLASKEIVNLTNSSKACHHPSWSPDGEQIIFTSDRTGKLGLYLINKDGTNERAIILDHAEKRDVFNPCFVAGGEKIAYVLKGDNGSKDSLWVSKLDGSESEKISQDDISVFEFDYSPSSKEFVFDVKVSDEPLLGDWDIFIMNEEGGDLKQLTDLKAMSSRPKWLSDGETIVFHSNRFGDVIEQPNINSPIEEWFNWWNQFELCTMDSKGNNIKRLTDNKFRNLHPDG